MTAADAFIDEMADRLAETIAVVQPDTMRRVLRLVATVVRRENAAALTELRARLDAAIAECCEYERVGTWPEVAAAKKIHVKLEGQR